MEMLLLSKFIFFGGIKMKCPKCPKCDSELFDGWDCKDCGYAVPLKNRKAQGRQLTDEEWKELERKLFDN